MNYPQVITINGLASNHPQMLVVVDGIGWISNSVFEFKSHVVSHNSPIIGETPIFMSVYRVYISQLDVTKGRNSSREASAKVTWGPIQ